MIRRMSGRKVCALLALAAACSTAALPARAAGAEDDPYVRLAAAHDPAIAVAIGALAVRQAGLRAVQARLEALGRTEIPDAEWNERTPEWQAARAHLLGIVDRLTATRIADPAWFHAAWTEVAARALDHEEADEVAAHFMTPEGREQRVVIETLVVGEMLLTSYTFTGRIDHSLPGAEREFAAMQRLWAEREPFRTRRYAGQPDAIRFATLDPGVKYTRTLAIQGVDAVLRHVDAVTRAAVQAVESENLDAWVSAFRARGAMR